MGQQNQLGSVSAITDASGGVLESRSFKPFGSPEQEWSEDSVINGFTGHEHDTDLGLINMRGRIYDPVVGRFLTADPFVTNPLRPQGWNRYAYVENNPLKFTDPSGFCTDAPSGFGANCRGGGGTGADPRGGGESGRNSSGGGGPPDSSIAPRDAGAGGGGPAVGPPGAEGGRGPGGNPPSMGHGPSTIANPNGFPIPGQPSQGTAPPAAGIGSDQTQLPQPDMNFDKRRGNFIGTNPAVGAGAACLAKPDVCATAGAAAAAAGALALPAAILGGTIYLIWKAVGDGADNDEASAPPIDAQAPGVPTADDGFVAPRNWDRKKVKNPNGPGAG